jgi:uncharacterized protein (TIGR03086 family)
VRDLLAHMVGSHRGFAAAAAAAPVGAEVWDRSTLGPVAYDTYRESAELVTRAFAADDLMGRSMVVHGYGTFPARTAMRMHAVDFLAHGWDVARAIGVDCGLETDLCLAGLEIASGWPDSAWGQGGPFAPRVAVAEDAPALDRLMAFLGRDPAWAPA